MTAEKMWEEFKKANPKADKYQAWQYGCDVDELAQLTLTGTKRGTASAYELYIAEGERIPEVGDYSIILDSKNEAVCIIKNIRVEIIPFKDIKEEHAIIEGEGDKSLSFWRRVHKDFFTNVLAGIGISFTEEMMVVFEEFKKVFPE